MLKNIVLIGMPGVGKSTIGVVLAKVLGFEFLDSDLLIQKWEKRRLPEIIESEGIPGFIEIENRINASINVENFIIATGGSAVYGKEAMEHFKQIGTIVYLKVSYETLQSRLGDLKNRGVVMKNGLTLRDLYKERCPLYEQYADLVIDEEHLDIRATVEQIVSQLN